MSPLPSRRTRNWTLPLERRWVTQPRDLDGAPTWAGRVPMRIQGVGSGCGHDGSTSREARSGAPEGIRGATGNPSRPRGRADNRLNARHVRVASRHCQGMGSMPEPLPLSPRDCPAARRCMPVFVVPARAAGRAPRTWRSPGSCCCSRSPRRRAPRTHRRRTPCPRKPSPPSRPRSRRPRACATSPPGSRGAQPPRRPPRRGPPLLPARPRCLGVRQRRRGRAPGARRRRARSGVRAPHLTLASWFLSASRARRCCSGARWCGSCARTSSCSSTSPRTRSLPAPGAVPRAARPAGLVLLLHARAAPRRGAAADVRVAHQRRAWSWAVARAAVRRRLRPRAADARHSSGCSGRCSRPRERAAVRAAGAARRRGPWAVGRRSTTSRRRPRDGRAVLRRRPARARCRGLAGDARGSAARLRRSVPHKPFLAVRARLDGAPRRRPRDRRGGLPPRARSCGRRTTARSTTSATCSPCRAAPTRRSRLYRRASGAEPRERRGVLQRVADLHAALRLPRRHRRAVARLGAQLRPGEDLPVAGHATTACCRSWTSGSRRAPSGPRSAAADRAPAHAAAHCRRPGARTSRAPAGAPAAAAAAGVAGRWSRRRPALARRRAAAHLQQLRRRRVPPLRRSAGARSRCARPAPPSEARAETPDFARVLLLQHRRKVRTRASAWSAPRSRRCVPGYGLLAFRRVVPRSLLLSPARRWSRVRAGSPRPFSYEPRLAVAGAGGLRSPCWSAAGLAVYAVSLFGYFASVRRAPTRADGRAGRARPQPRPATSRDALGARPPRRQAWPSRATSATSRPPRSCSCSAPRRRPAA